MRLVEREVIDRNIKDVLVELEAPCPNTSAIDTRAEIYRLALTAAWDARDFNLLDFFSGKINTAKKLRIGYTENGDGSEVAELSSSLWKELLVLLLLKGVSVALAVADTYRAMRYFNTIFKSIELWRLGRFSPEAEVGLTLEALWSSSCSAKLPSINSSGFTQWTLKAPQNKPTVTLPLTVLFYEGPIARAYLEAIKTLGIKPTKIIEILPKQDLATGKDIGRLMPSSVRSEFIRRIQRSRIHYWPQFLKRHHQTEVLAVMHGVKDAFGFSLEQMYDAAQLKPLSDYSESVETIVVSNLADAVLERKLVNQPAGEILFTGGGMVPKRLVETGHIRFIHCHPGYLPDLRGADCVLWSILLRGRLSCSCFYMASGIDTGDVILSLDLPYFCVDLSDSSLSTKNIYRLVYSFLDPWVRAAVLRNVLVDSVQSGWRPAAPQNLLGTAAMNFMHEKIQAIAVNKLLKIDPKS